MGAVLAGQLVLVVDGDFATREILSLVLEGEGALVTVANGVLEARKRLVAQIFDLVVIATDLPDGDGAELVSFINDCGFDCATVLLTDGEEANGSAGGRVSGVTDYVFTPLPQIAELRRRLSRAVEMHALGRKNRALTQELRARDEQIAEMAGTGRAAALRSYRRDQDAVERSIASSSFDFVYQPIVSARSGRVYGYEALCRPRDPAFPNPMALIESAERCGCTAALGRALRQRGVQALGQLPQGSLLFLNLHPEELRDPEFIAIESFVAQWAGQVVFEITEVAKIADFDHVGQVIARLRGSGFRVALDDVGAGYSGLEALARLEPDFVKLDMRLVHALSTDRRTRRLVKHILEFARDEGMQVVAEGIETERQREAVVDLGCPLLQGYLFGKGKPLAEVLQRAGQPSAPAAAACMS